MAMTQGMAFADVRSGPFPEPFTSSAEKIDLSITHEELSDAYESIRFAGQKGPSRRGTRSILDPVKDLGTRLFNSLFRGQIGRIYRDSVAAADMEAKRLRVCLTTSPGSFMEQLPWEFLFDPIRNDFLALSVRRPVLRQIVRKTPKQLSPLSPSRPLRALFATSPDPGQVLGTDRDREVLSKLADSMDQRLKIIDVGPVTQTELLDAFTNEDPDVLHFAGHADEQVSGYTSGRQLLQVVGANGVDHLPSWAMINAFRRSTNLRLVYLSSCNTDLLAREFAEEVPAVIGFRKLVSTDFCVEFARALYREVLRGSSVEEAMTAARQLSDTVNPGGREWGMAVLCTHALSPTYVASRRARSERQIVGVSGASRATDPTRQREWLKLSQLLELNQRNLQSLEKRLEILNPFDEQHEVVRSISQGSVGSLPSQIDDLRRKVSEIEARMRALEN
jgi:hypothetical protein